MAKPALHNHNLGTATAAYQIEGAYNEGGKGLNIWDDYSRQSYKVARGETGDVACDHYHRWQDDIELLKLYGVKCYRLSISWARIVPSGKRTDVPNEG